MPTGVSGHSIIEKPPSAPGDEHHTISRVRSRVACRGCNIRKVRCDVVRGIPCSNCSHEGSKCEVLPRKKHRPRRTKSALIPADGESHRPPDRVAATKAKGISRNDIIERLTGRITHTSGAIHLDSNEDTSPELHSSHQSQPDSTPETTATSPLDAGDILPDDSSLSYIGDRRGARRFVYDICAPGTPQDARPFFLPETRSVPWKSHELEYLNHQDVFKIPPAEVCDELIRCYFHHVHFFLPILDVPSFLNEYTKNGPQNISLLLLWSMFIAAANVIFMHVMTGFIANFRQFVDSDTLRQAGFVSRKAMKTAMYERAKALYDLDHGTDKLTLIQSVIFMGFWYTDPQDHTGAWYWTGIAIGLCQNLGLHRGQQSRDRSQQGSDPRQSLTRRIWWTCLIRDRWLSLAKGRPMRIHSEDCDVPMASDADVTDDFQFINGHIRTKFIPTDYEVLSKMWVSLVKVSITLGSVLRTHYSAKASKSTIADFRKDMEEVKRCKPQIVLPDLASQILLLHAYQLDLFYEATAVVLFRPYVLGGDSSLLKDGSEDLQKTALTLARISASNTNSVLDKIIGIDGVHFLKQMIITAMIPAMQIHLLDCKSTDPLRRGLGANKLNLCMLVVSQLKGTYWSASVIYRLFERAQDILQKSHAKSRQGSRQSTRPNDFQNDFNSQIADQTDEYQPLGVMQQERQQRSEQMVDYVEPTTTMEVGQPINGSEMPLWLDDSPSFSAVDQLLSPGFSLNENAFPSVFTDFDGGGVLSAYDQMIPLPMSQLNYGGPI